MKKANFKKDDLVVVGSHTGTIISCKKENGKYLHTVRFDNKRLIPPEMDYEEKHIKLQKCMVCDEPWHVTRYNTQVWYDCVKCNKTKEQIEKETEKAAELMLEDLSDYDIFGF
jgi:hypothetical protein